MDDIRRRLSDKIIAAHKQACDEKKPEVAELLLEAMELDFSAAGGTLADHREAVEEIGDVYDRHEALLGRAKSLK